MNIKYVSDTLRLQPEDHRNPEKIYFNYNLSTFNII